MTIARTPLIILVVLVAALISVGGYRWYITEKGLQQTQSLLQEATTSIEELQQSLTSTQEENQELAANLASEQARNEAFAGQINDISGTVGKLDKLSKLDPELLQKYSKVYFLNENYTPAPIKKIPDELTYQAQEEYFHAKALSYLEEMIHDAAEDDVDMSVLSGYRSFGTQAILKANYRVTYGTGANAFSADQGYSEHQLATTIDFTTNTLGGGLTGFDKTSAFTWLTEHAYKYGFVLSYPKSNSYYQYEPWHWRFVGTDLAETLHDDEKYFYDLDQREIDTYLVNIFE